MSFEFFLALRYLRTKRHGIFGVLTTLIASGGITLGVAALIVTLSVMNGFRADITEKTLGISPHILLLGVENETPLALETLAGRALGVAGVESTAPFIFGQTLAKSGRSAQGVVVRGIKPEKEFKVTGVEKTLISGDWSLLSGENSSRKYVFLGKELAHALSVTPGADILLFSPTEKAALGLMGGVPKVESYNVGGIFQSGYYEYDANLAILSFENAQRLFSLKGASAIGIKTTDLENAQTTSVRVAEAAGLKYWARSWQSMNRNLFEALKLEKIVMSVILTMIVLVATFTIISNLILMSIEKTRDIGILRAQGASRASIRRIFLYAGITLGSAGIAAGTALGLILSKILQTTKLIKLPQDVYYLDTLPILIQWDDVAIVVVCALVITSLSALYPANEASKINPVEAIRFG